MQQAAQAEEAKRPKRTFNMPGNNSSAFSQMMRQQMGGVGSAGPRKLDHLDKKNYKDLANTQAATAKDKV